MDQSAKGEQISTPTGSSGSSSGRSDKGSDSLNRGEPSGEGDHGQGPGQNPLSQLAQMNGLASGGSGPGTDAAASGGAGSGGSAKPFSAAEQIVNLGSVDGNANGAAGSSGADRGNAALGSASSGGNGSGFGDGKSNSGGFAENSLLNSFAQTPVSLKGESKALGTRREPQSDHQNSLEAKAGETSEADVSSSLFNGLSKVRKFLTSLFNLARHALATPIGVSLWFLLLLLLLKRSRDDKKKGHPSRGNAAMAGMAIAGVLIGWGMTHPEPSQLPTETAALTPIGGIASRVIWYTNEDEALLKAQQLKLPVFIDFGADWCTTCRVLDKTLLTDPDVKAKLTHFISLKIDVTAQNKTNEAKLKRFGVPGLPTFVFVNRSGKIVETRLNGLVQKDALLKMLDSL